VPSERAGEFKDGARFVARVVAVRMAQEGADHHIVDDAHIGKCGRHLKGAADAGARMRFRRRAREVLAVEDDSPTARHGLAGEAIEKGRLAGAVRTDQPDDVTLVDGEIGAGHGAKLAEILRHIGRVQKFAAVRHGAVSAKCREEVEIPAATNRTSRPARTAQSAR
jgi:hypothetical protein